MKKKIIFSFILGMLISVLGVYASVSISSDKISYKDTTVDVALDNLFDESVSGKAKIAEAITNKGIETLDTDSYDTIVSNINNISTGNPNLRFDEETGYVQIMDTNGNWTNIYYVSNLPLSKSYVFNNGILYTDYQSADGREFSNALYHEPTKVEISTDGIYYEPYNVSGAASYSGSVYIEMPSNINDFNKIKIVGSVTFASYKDTNAAYSRYVMTMADSIQSSLESSFISSSYPETASGYTIKIDTEYTLDKTKSNNYLRIVGSTTGSNYVKSGTFSINIKEISLIY